MPTQILRPIAQGFYDDAGWTFNGGAGGNDWDDIDPGDPVVHDNAVSWMNAGGAASNMSMLVTKRASAASVSAFDIHARRTSNAVGNQDTELWARMDGVNSAFHSYTDQPAVYTNYSNTPCNRPGGGVWGPNDLGNVIEVCFQYGAPAVSICTLTSLWFEMTYVPTSGGWSCLVAQFLGPVLGVGLLLAQMPDLIGTFNQAAAGKTIIHGHEAAEMYADLRANKHRSYPWL